MHKTPHMSICSLNLAKTKPWQLSFGHLVPNLPPPHFVQHMTLPSPPPCTHHPITSPHRPPPQFTTAHLKLSPSSSDFNCWPQSCCPCLHDQMWHHHITTTLYVPPYHLPQSPLMEIPNGTPITELNGLDFDYWPQTHCPHLCNQMQHHHTTYTLYVPLYHLPSSPLMAVPNSTPITEPNSSDFDCWLQTHYLCLHNQTWHHHTITTSCIQTYHLPPSPLIGVLNSAPITEP